MSAPMLNTFQQVSHAMLPETTHDEQARQEFTKSFKGFIQGGLLPGLTPVYTTRVAKAFEREHGRPPRTGATSARAWSRTPTSSTTRRRTGSPRSCCGRAPTSPSSAS